MQCAAAQPLGDVDCQNGNRTNLSGEAHRGRQLRNAILRPDQTSDDYRSYELICKWVRAPFAKRREPGHRQMRLFGCIANGSSRRDEPAYRPASIETTAADQALAMLQFGPAVWCLLQ